MMDKTFEEKIKKLKAGVDGLLDRISDKREPYFNGQAVGLNYVKELIDITFPELKESEDERIRKEIIGYLNSRVATAEETELLYFKRWLAYLEKQKDQKPAEWSEEDEYRRQQVIDALERNGYNVLTDWLKSLRPQPHWKPSEEQMEAVLTAQSVGSYGHRKALAELYNDLKKVAHEDSSRHTDSPKKER